MFIIILIEILIFIIGGTTLYFHKGEKVSESIAKGMFLTLLIISFSFQISFLLNHPPIAFIIELIIFSISLYIIAKNIKKIKAIGERIKSFYLQYKFILSILLIVWLYLFLQAVLLPPSNWDSMTYNLARVLLFQQEKSLFLTEVSLESQAIFPVGSDILHHSFLRFYTDYGIGIFSFIAYLIICFGTYSLARRYASQEHSLITTLVIASLPELVLQSTSTKNDILTACVAIFCFILAYRLLTNINVEDLILLPISLSFGISCKTTFIAFAFPFIVIFSYLLIKQYSWQFFREIIIKYKAFFLVSTLPILVFLPLFTFYHNYNHFGSWNGSEEFADLHKQTNGIKGTLGNLVRYIFQSIDFLEPLELTSKYITEKIFNGEGYTITDYLMKFYNNTFHLIFGDSGIMKSPLFPLISNNDDIPFFILRVITDDSSWFGIFGFVLVIPSVIFCVFKGDLFLKAVSINLISYSLILCNQLAWQPWANRFFPYFLLLQEF